MKIKKQLCVFLAYMLWMQGCLMINPTYSKLSKAGREKIHIEPFASDVVAPGSPSNADQLVVKDITYDQLNGLVKQSHKKLKWVLIYTSLCRGTPHMLPYVKQIKNTYGNDIDIFLLASDDYATANSVKKKLFQYGITFQTYIINNSYGEFKDDRQKGVLIRNMLCETCKPDLIGVPYNIVLDRDNKIIFTKYRSYKNVGDSLVGNDFIGDLYNK